MPFSLATRRAVSLATLLFLSLLLPIFSSGKVAHADNFQMQPLQLSTTSGPTGTILTIRGSNLQDFVQFGYGYLEIVRPQPADDASPSFLIFGLAYIKSDGTFSWTGPLPRSGTTSIAPNSGQPFNVPVGKITIHFGLYNVFGAANADFTVTDNTQGPIVDGKDINRANAQMNARWLKTDSLVRDGTVRRSWLWGPLSDGVTGLMEPYKEAPNGWRWVQYFDKTRMEVTYPDKALTDSYYVTNGLLVKEMATGNLQLGDSSFQNIGAAQIPAAGDLGANTTPTFADYGKLLSRNDNQVGNSIVETLSKGGVVSTDNSLEGKYGIYPAIYVADTSHYIAYPFWQYLNSTGPLLDIDNGGAQVTGKLFDPLFYATGYPITEAYWTKTTVGGEQKDVLVQLFERRVLTYTPSNPNGFQVEMGNVGLEYYSWRYDSHS